MVRPVIAGLGFVAAAGTAYVAGRKAHEISNRHKEKKAARRDSQQFGGPAAGPSSPSLTVPPHPGQVPLRSPPEPEVFSPGFNIHPELSRVPTLMDGAEVSEDVRMLAGMYNRTYETPEYDATAALEMIMGHPAGNSHGKKSKQSNRDYDTGF